MSKANVIVIIILLILFSIIGVLIFIFSKNEQNSDNSTQYEQLVLVKDPSVFFSVASNVNKLYEYLQLNNTFDAYSLLNETYKKDNNITEVNLINKLNIEDVYVSFSAKEMYVVSEKEKYKYLVKGYIRKEFMDVAPKILGISCYILNYNIEEGTYSIELISEDEYSEYIKSGKISFDNFSTGSDNCFEITNISDNMLANVYFYDFMNDLYSNPEYAYERIDNETKLEYFDTYDKFIDNFNNNINYYSSIRFTGYNISGNVYRYVDNYYNEYKFTVYNVMNYTVNIKFKDSQE